LSSNVVTAETVLRFDWKGKTYKGSHEPLISFELFDRVQKILDGRFVTKQKVSKHEFAFSGFVSCGHADVLWSPKEGTANTSTTIALATKENAQSHTLAKRCSSNAWLICSNYLVLVFDDEVMDGVVEALHQSHSDQKKFREEAITRLQAEQTKLQNRLDRLYEDRRPIWLPTLDTLRIFLLLPTKEADPVSAGA
jgi:site-specific DNA recombinase